MKRLIAKETDESLKAVPTANSTEQMAAIQTHSETNWEKWFSVGINCFLSLRT